MVFHNGGTIIDVNPTPNPFSELALRTPGGAFIQQPSGSSLPEMLQVMQQDMDAPNHP